MAQLIRFADGVLMEVARDEKPFTPVAGRTAERVNEAFQSAAELIGGVLRPVVTSAHRALKDAGATEAELQIAVGFSIEGYVYVAKAASEGNMTLRVKIGSE